MKKSSLWTLALTAGLTICYSSAMACHLNIIVKNHFPDDQNATITVKKPVNLKNIVVNSDTLKDSKLYPSYLGKSEGKLVLSPAPGFNGSENSAFTINTPAGDCAVNFGFKAGKFSYAGDSGTKACDATTTILKKKDGDYFIILDFANQS